MSPLWVVGLLIITLLSPIHADVKHVLDGTAHPPQCKCSQTQYHQQVPNYVPSQSNNVAPGSPAFWWTDTNNSPFKHAYEYFKKCSVTGGCVTPIAGNPQPLPQTQNHISEESRFGFESIKKNPFLSGQVQVGAYENSNSIFGTTSENNNSNNNKIDISQNPFFNKDLTTFSASGQSVTNPNGFLGVQPNVPFNNQNKAQSNFQFGNNFQQAKKFENCKNKEYVCVANDQCLNGVVQVYGEQLLNLKTSTDYCEVGKEVCCRLPNLSNSQQTTSLDSYTVSKPNINFGFANLSEFTSGKSSIPGAKINFGGGAGLSPGFIQVLPVEDDTSKGSVGQNDALAAAGSSYNNKVVRNTTPNPNLIFGTTRDYSNDKYDKFDFQSQFAGPQYLPPHKNVETPRPVISTYQPSIPTTARPIVTRPPYVPSESVISIHTNPPFVPSSPQPFTFAPTTKQPVTFYQPKLTTARNEYLPPSTPKPFVFSTTKAPVYTKPSTPKLFTIKPYYTPSTTLAPIPQPSQTVNRITPGYRYPTPTPAFEYPTTTKQPYVPVQTVTVNKYVPPETTRYIPPKTTQYIPPKTTQYVPPKTTQYIPPKISTVGYFYEKPSPPFQGESSFQVNNQYLTPSTPRPISTNGYVYTKPSPTFKYPIPDTSNTVTNRYIPPVTASTNGYSYYTPSSTYTYPTIKITPPTTPKPYSQPNQYLPPITEAGSNPFPVYESTTSPNLYIPPITGLETNVNANFVSATCAAALRCVPLEYCTSQGTISQTPVVLTKEQAEFRVPTTQCFDKETQVSGYCCRDPDYVDPWPSANLLNGEDDGKYREDPNLGQYFPQQQRVIRSKVERSSNDLVSNRNFQQSPKRVTTEVKDENTCGIRHTNTIPQGKGPIDVNFAEIPWQAMILRDSNRSLLCGGVIVKRNVVLTAAHCVEGIATSDVLIKGGEWKLGIDEEPLPFQIVKVSAIVRHPNYKAGILQNDLALLILQENLNIANNIAPICLPSANQPAPTKCIATGWGKRILQAHLRNAIMRSIEVNILDSKQCSDVISNKYQHALQDYSPSTICGYSSNDQCDVDYGSALACTNDGTHYTLSGIFSWDTGCKDSSQIGGYIAPDYQWIESISSKPLTHLKDLDRQYRRQ